MHAGCPAPWQGWALNLALEGSSPQCHRAEVAQPAAAQASLPKPFGIHLVGAFLGVGWAQPSR